MANANMIDFGQMAPQSKFNACSQKVVQALPRLPLYPAQRDALLGLQAHFLDANKPNIALVVLPTGAGKSGVAALAPYVLNSTRVLVITPSIIVLNQMAKDMASELPGQTFYERKGLCTQASVHNMRETAHVVLKSLGDNSDNIAAYLKSRNLVLANAHKFGATSNVDIGEIPVDLFDTVIVDEAHHYPAATWKKIVDHFKDSKRIFLTATPFYRGQQILGDSMQDQRDRFVAFQLTRSDAVRDKILRPLAFDEVGAKTDSEATRCKLVIDRMVDELQEHDNQDQSIQHQAMLLCTDTSEVDTAVRIINSKYGRDFAVPHHSKTENDMLFEHFRGGGGPRILVVCKKAVEGFDRPEVSVVGILRNVAPTSLVLFSQFVGRCVRRINTSPAAQARDCVTAMVVSHVFHKQQRNFDAMDQLAEVDPEDD